MDSAGTNSTCTHTPASTSDAGSGTPGWVWAIVGVVATISVAAAAAGVVMWQRRHRSTPLQRVTVEPWGKGEAAQLALACRGGTGSKDAGGGDSEASGGQQQLGSTAKTMHSGEEVQGGVWRSRWVGCWLAGRPAGRPAD